jgi:hypothetical protein
VEPINIRFGGGAAESILHPMVALILVVTIALTLFGPRKYVIIPWLSTALLVPFGQVLVLGGVHFTVYRIIVLFGLVRLAKTRLQAGTGWLAGGLSGIDRAFALYSLFTLITFSLQWMETQAFIKGVGNLLDSLGGYFVVRFLIRDRETMRRTIKVMVVITIVLAACMISEQVTHNNAFGLLGGTPPLEVAIRDGKTRSTGAFAVYITAGVFGATVLPLFMWLWANAKSKVALLGMTAATVMMLTSNSSTPLMAYVAGIVGFCFWPLRRRMRAFRWGVVMILVALHLSMKAPVWALIARIDLTGSSSGFHRYMLVDQCIRHVGDWWLMGVKNYNEWGYDMWDLSNQYVACAATGGLATIVTFILVISCSFGRLGTARRLVKGDRKREWSLWCLGAALLAHVVAYFGIGYFDQMQVAWYALLAMIVIATSEAITSRVPRAKGAMVARHEPAASVNWPFAGQELVGRNT